MLPKALRVLKLRQAALRVTGAKIDRALDLTRDTPVLQDLITYHQAHTGRFSSRRMQIHNLPRDRGVDFEKVLADPTLSTIDAEAERLGCTPDDVIACLVRPCLIARDHFLIADYAQVEARCVAWMAGDAGMLDAFRGDPYVELGKRWWDEITKARRHVAKTVFLGCLAEGTPILTQRGFIAIEYVRENDLLWDGGKWVRHGGVVYSGEQKCREINRVWMTDRHKVLTDGGWLPAGSIEGLTYLSATYSGDGRLWLLNPDGKERDTIESSVNATVDVGERYSETICKRVKLRNALSAAEKSLVGTGDTSQSSIPFIPSDFLRELPEQSVGVLTQKTTLGDIMAGVGSQYIPNGYSTEWRSYDTFSPSTGGTTPDSTSIGQTTTEDTNRGISDSSAMLKICETGVSVRVTKTYDILDSGPRNRFQAGGLIVHNSIYGMSGRKFGEYCDLRGVDLEAVGLTAEAAIAGFRESYPKVVELWRGFDAAMWRALAGQETEVGRCFFDFADRSMRIRLPSGRRIWYRGARREERPSKWDGKLRPTMVYDSPTGERIAYGSYLVENASQGTCRDLLCDALVRAPNPVFHVHDEIVCDGEPEQLPELCDIMERGPEWARGFPIKVEGFVSKRYTK